MRSSYRPRFTTLSDGIGANVSSFDVHLVDGTYELFRAYFGAPSRTGASGQEVGAVVALLRSFAGWLKNPDVTHVACAFDHVIESFRNELFAGYKTGEGIEPALRGQFGLAEEVTRGLGIATWPMVQFEADDALASGAALCARDDRVRNIFLCTPDKDLAQCVRGTRVVMWDRRKQFALDEAGVNQKYGVPPESIADWLALVGDSADGIPGIPRFGAKSSAAVLRRYRHIEEIPAEPEDWDVTVRGKATLAANLRAERSQALLYRTLATLRADVPLSPDPTAGADALRWPGPDQNLLAKVCTELREPLPRT